MNRQEENSIETTLDIYFKSGPKTVENVFVSPAPEIGESSLVLDSRTDEEVFADFIKSQEGKYIEKEGDKFVVSRVINGERKVFGKYTTYEFAAEFERNLIINGWHDLFNNSNAHYGKFIIESNNKYYIYRKIDGEKINFGSFPNLMEALLKREELIDENWGSDAELNFSRKSKFGKYISYSGDVFVIQKNLNGKIKTFGSYDNIDNATIARDILVENNWDESKIPQKLYSWRYFTNYHANTNSWAIFNYIGNDSIFCGLFKTPDFAKKALRILIANDWDCSSVPLEYYHEKSHIKTFKRFNRTLYSVFMRINGEDYPISSFDDKTEATNFRNNLLLSNWELEEEEEQFDKYIFIKGDQYTVKNNGEVYGVFDKICDASDFVIECVKNNWWNGDSYFT